MKIRTIIHELEREYPPELALEWDNSGLQVGTADRGAGKAAVALDATWEVIEACAAQGVELLVTHHPLLMTGIRKINGDTMQGRKILKLIGNGITHYALHTNYDIAKMAELSAQALKLINCSPLEPTGTSPEGEPYGIGTVGELPESMTAAGCCACVKEAFGLAQVRLFGDREKEIRRAAICPGSGKSMIQNALEKGAQILITGDIGHHDGLDAVDSGLAVIDAGHYGLEKLFIPQMADFLRQRFPELQIFEIQSGDPFTVLS